MRKLIVGLLCLAGLAVVIDFGAAAYSEYRVSRTLRVGAELSADPEVTFHGFPFLRQAMDGRYNRIEITARSMRPDIPGEIALEATLAGMRLPVGRLWDGSVRGVPVEQVDVRMRVEPTELGRLFDIPDLQVHSAPADKSDGTGGSGGSGMTTGGALILTGTLPAPPSGQLGTSGFAGERVSVEADLLLVGDQVRIVATDIYHGPDSDGAPVPAMDDASPVISDADRPAVLARFTRTIDTKELPFGIRPTEVSALGGQIVVEGRGEHVTIDLDRLRRQ